MPLRSRRRVALCLATLLLCASGVPVCAHAGLLPVTPAPGVRLQSYNVYGSLRRHTVAVTGATTFSIPVEVPPDARLLGAVAVPDRVWTKAVVERARPTRFRVRFRDGDDVVELYDRTIDIRARPADRRWFDFGRDLAPLAGRQGTLEFETSGAGDGEEKTLALWATPDLARCPEAGPSVLLITLDAMRGDHQSGTGYARPTTPYLDAFAETASRFTSAFTGAPKTMPSIPQILTGRYFPDHGEENPLTPLLGPGRLPRSRAIVNNPHVTRWLDTQEPGFDVRTAGTLDARAITSDALRFLSAAGRCRTLLYLHYLEPHTPYQPPARYARRFVDPQAETDLGLTFDDVTGAWQGRYGPVDRQRIVDLYDGTITYVDRQLGRLFRGLARRGRLDDTIVVVTADHGEEFWDHGQFFHGQSLFDELLHVPLIVRLPRGGRPRVVDDVVSTVDVLPTILDAAALPPADTDGMSLVPSIQGAPAPDAANRIVFATVSHAEPRTPPRHAVRSARSKIVRTVTDGTVAVYDLKADPEERHPDAAPPDARELRSVLDAVRLRTADTGYQLRVASQLDREAEYVVSISGQVANAPDAEAAATAPINMVDIDRLTLEDSDFVIVGERARALTLRGRLAPGEDDHLRFDVPAAEGALQITMLIDGEPAGEGAIRIGTSARPGRTSVTLDDEALDTAPGAAPADENAPAVTATLWRVPNARGGDAPPPLTPEEEERLRALGYLD